MRRIYFIIAFVALFSSLALSLPSGLRPAAIKSYEPVPPLETITFRAVSRGALGSSANGFAQFEKNGVAFYHETGGAGGGRGFNVAAIDTTTGELIQPAQNFDTWGTRDTGTAMNAMIGFLNSLPNGTLIMIAVGDEAGLNAFNSCTRLNFSWVESGLQALESLGSTRIRDYCYRDSWTMITVKGESQARGEQLGTGVDVSVQTTITVGPSCAIASDINPDSGTIGSTVTIKGTDLDGVSAVRFSNNVAAVFSINSPTEIAALVPDAAVTGPITISKPGCDDIQTTVFTVAGAPGGTSTTQDFDTPGTPYRVGRCVNPPGPLPTIMQGGLEQNFLRLATTVLPDHNTIAFNRTSAGASDVVVADFDFRIAPKPPGRADGFAFAFLNTAIFGSAGAACPTAVAEEPNYPGSLGVGFDIHKAGDGSDIGDDNIRGSFSNSISIHFNGAVLSQTDVSPVIDLGGGEWIHARIILRPGGGFSDVSVVLTPFQGKPVAVVDKFKINGFTPYEGRIQFGARSGGETAHFDLDNVRAQFLSFSQSIFSFDAVSYYVDENGISAAVTVKRDGDASTATSVQYVTADGSAIAGSDYVSDADTIAFAAGETSKSFSIPIINDGSNEGEEAFKVALRNPAGSGVIAGPATTTITIFDDESSRLLGRRGGIIRLPVLPVHAHLLPTGTVMFWDRFGATRLLEPTTQNVITPQQPGHDIFCSGHSFLADGRLLVTGGHHHGGNPADDGEGIPTASLYDPVANTWTMLPDMSGGRWYPTNTTLGNGDVLVLSGSVDTAFGKNPLPEVWQPASGSWRPLNGAQNLAPLGVDLYPRVFLMDDGRVFKAGPDKDTWFLNLTGAGAWTAGPLTNLDAHRTYGSAVMYSPGKILTVGGGDPPTATAEVIDLGSANPAWRSIGPMASARRHLNATLLPDGNVMVTGGSSGPGFNDEASPVFGVEMWNSATELWATLSSLQISRFYHSVAMLLPDGRVIAAGGGHGGGAVNIQNNAEIYLPPYLFKGPQPKILSAPPNVAYGQTVFVSTPNASITTKVSLIRLPSVTHAFDQNQRFLSLNFSIATGGLNVTMPASANVCPPGHYMMFILNTSGVPSVARIVKIAAAACGLSISPTSQSFAANGGTGSISMMLPAGCNRTAVSNDSWISITSGGNGSGNGTVAYSVAANNTATSRVGTINISGEIFTIVQGAQFSDVLADNPFFSFIGKLSARGVTVGCGGGNYCPSQSVTREQMAAFLIRALGEFDPPAPTHQRFADVPPSSPFFKVIDRMATLGITVGCGTSSEGQPIYCPNEIVTREQMAAFIIRALGEVNPPAPATQRFADVPPGSPFFAFIDRMAALSITSGCGGGNYCPTAPVTREQMATFLVRAFGL